MIRAFRLLLAECRLAFAAWRDRRACARYLRLLGNFEPVGVAASTEGIDRTALRARHAELRRTAHVLELQRALARIVAEGAGPEEPEA